MLNHPEKRGTKTTCGAFLADFSPDWNTPCPGCAELEAEACFFQDEIALETSGRGLFELTGQIAASIHKSAVRNGMAQLLCRHTSASVLMLENAASAVRTDLERFLVRLVPDGDALFTHTDEGADDMPAHIRSVLTGADVGFPVRDGRPALGSWQGIFLFEHRLQPHTRNLILSVIGE